ncbi:hypothetical protein MKK75_11400 [Methylobacterium sp. J-030]|uniref:phage protein n=1 Tax=Methylobacterium sp. J-030 TaxID=2836627 RepID=UPI001FB913D8|nr:hypothetical protein [Methylobacterium sp. J-030]MCJ2069389.1 hypothetical protein [Methylobacterium sp. J-030]
MAKKFQRYFNITLGKSGLSLDLSQFRVRFVVKSYESQTPQHVEAYIYNLSRQTEQKISKEFDNVKIEAGYQDVHGLIFDGDLMQKRAGRENPVDTYLAILARSGYKGNGYAVVNTALEKGHTKRDVVDACMKAFAEHGLRPGYITDLGPSKAIRGTTLHGMARDAMRTLCQGANATFNFENGKVNVRKNGEFKPGSTIKLNSQTGMIGRPEATIDGVIVRMLMEPNCQIGTKLQIDEASINQAAYSPVTMAEGSNRLLDQIVATDGIYQAISVDHFGDTHGLDWYTEAVCLRADGGAFISPAVKARGVPLPEAYANQADA